MKKDQYEAPDFKILMLNNTSVITTSTGEGINKGDTITDPDYWFEN